MAQFNPAAWDGLLEQQDAPIPFMRHAYLQGMEQARCATPQTGWQPCHIGLWQGDALLAACPVYLKAHSWGEYVFDFTWADAYQRHGLEYYPKALVAVPFTPVPGSRLLAATAQLREQLLHTLVQWCGQQQLSSLHMLLGSEADMQAAQQLQLLSRTGVQFHWRNPHGGQLPAQEGQPGSQSLEPYPDWQAFLASLQRDKRRKIVQEQRKVREAGVQYRWSQGQAIAAADWQFFQACYERTYLEHGNPPYLGAPFWELMRATMAQHWLLFIAERHGRPIASSLIGLDDGEQPTTAYGRYWGALERVDSLHFDLCYYQPLAWCIAHRVQRFEGGAQGEHKMARALMPVPTHSAHWIADARFRDAITQFLVQERAHISGYLEHLQTRSPFRRMPEAKACL